MVARGLREGFGEVGNAKRARCHSGAVSLRAATCDALGSVPNLHPNRPSKTIATMAKANPRTSRLFRDSPNTKTPRAANSTMMERE